MAFKISGECYLDADDVVDRKCIWCDEVCNVTQVLDTGEEIELWCYCENCDSEMFKQIKNKNNL